MSSDDDATPTALWQHALAEAERLAALDPAEREAAWQALPDTDAKVRVRQLMGPGAARTLAPVALPLSSLADLSGQQVGSYRFVRLLGEGGMGQVWLAERTDGRFEGQVAIKLLATALQAGRLERLVREGQILGRLSHPCIARLLDAGALPSGAPFLVLERVDGQRIDRFCDAHGLSVPERLRLFIEVCAAVSHAHANLVVHRDLKPSNILVGADGRPKLLDFGIAKLIEGDTGDGAETALTQQFGRAMTPEYAAPEQVRGEAVSTATDVYALGVLLYGLLVGRSPYGRTAATPLAWAQLVLDADAQPLTQGDLAAAAAACASTPARLRRELQGDLENIVARALKKQPAERYASVQALSDDLRRALDHEPVQARADSVTYRAGKFVRRHRVPVLAAAVATVALCSGLGLAVWQSQVARHERHLAQQEAAGARLARAQALNQAEQAQMQRAEAQRQSALAAGHALTAERQARRADRRAAEADQARQQADASARAAREQTQLAQVERDRTREVTDFLVDLFQTSSLDRGGPAAARQVTAKDLLDRGAARLRAEASVRSDLGGQLLLTLGLLYGEIGEHAQAAALLDEAVQHSRAGPASQRPEVARRLVNLAAVHLASGHFERARAALDEADAVFVQLGDERSDERGLWHIHLAQLHGARDAALALQHARRAIAILDKDPDRVPRVPQLRSAYAYLGHAHARSGDLVAAEAAHRRALDVAVRVAGARSHPAAVSLVNLGELQLMRGQLRAAEASLREGAQLMRTVNAEDAVGIAQAELRLGRLLHAIGERDSGLALMRSAGDTFEQRFGAEAVTTLHARQLLVGRLVEDGEHEPARQLLDQVQPVYERLPHARANLATALNQRARLAIHQGDLVRARTWLDKSRTLLQATGGVRGATAMDAQRLLAEIDLMEGRHEESLQRFRSAAESVVPRGLVFSSTLLRMKLHEARVAMARGQPATAAGLADEVERLLLQAPDGDLRGDLLAQALKAQGEAWAALGDPGRARAAFERAGTLMERWHGQASVQRRAVGAQLAALARP